jgi:hypothetical protein
MDLQGPVSQKKKKKIFYFIISYLFEQISCIQHYKIWKYFLRIYQGTYLNSMFQYDFHCKAYYIVLVLDTLIKKVITKTFDIDLLFKSLMTEK